MTPSIYELTSSKCMPPTTSACPVHLFLVIFIYLDMLHVHLPELISQYYQHVPHIALFC